MPTITAQSIVDRAETILFDDTNVRWAASELLDYLNEAQRVIVMVKPDSHIGNSNVLLVTGTKQGIPADGVRLIRVVRNMGTAGNVPGKAVKKADMETLDNVRPDWHSETAAAAVNNWMQDEFDPKNFYVTPPQPSSGQNYVEIIYSKAPANVAALGNVITLDDIYSSPIHFLILSLALAKESTTQNMQKSAGYYATAMQLLGAKTSGEQAIGAANG